MAGDTHEEPRASADTPVGGFTTTVTSRTHHITADEPEGTDAGMTPIEMLLGSLCACTTITARMYAERKGWDVRTIRASAVGKRDRGDVGPLDAIDVLLTIEGDLDEAQRERLVDIAGRCPVHRTLAGGTTVRVTDADRFEND